MKKIQVNTLIGVIYLVNKLFTNQEKETLLQTHYCISKERMIYG